MEEAGEIVERIRANETSDRCQPGFERDVGRGVGHRAEAQEVEDPAAASEAWAAVQDRAAPLSLQRERNGGHDGTGKDEAKSGKNDVKCSLTHVVILHAS